MKTDFPKQPLAFLDDAAKGAALAYDGGTAAIEKSFRKTVFPSITKEDVLQMILSASREPQAVLDRFTEQYRSYVGANYALATASGTCSLQLALIGAGVKPGDEVIIPAFTFIATAQAVVAAEAIPVFVDVDPDTYCMSPDACSAAITDRTAAIMPVHVHGLPADMVALGEIADKNGLLLIEDASHAHSASIDGQICGSIGNAAGQSLMADKNFPVGGEGGMSFFKDAADLRRAQAYISRTGADYGMSWIAASFGSSQLARLSYYDEIRRRNAAYLDGALNATALFSPPQVPTGSRHSYNMYRLKLNPEAIDLQDIPVHRLKDAVQQIILAEGVPAREWQNRPIPLHTPFLSRKGFGDGYPFTLGNPRNVQAEDFPNTLKMLESTLVLCRELRAPVEYERIQRYALAFEKIDRDHGRVLELARASNALPPHLLDARLG